MKKQLSYLLQLLFAITLFLGYSVTVNAATYDNFDVTWYYRVMANESNLLNVVKDEETPFYKATDEYVNGFTTRLEQPFSKDIQYIINYKLEMYYDISQDQYFRNDTIDRIIQYSWVDSDFKLLNTTVKQTEYECLSASICTRTISVTQQVLAINNTSAIRFGIYTTENKSIGFYNSTQQVNYLMINNITIDENANSTIVDQNNQIIQGQDKIEQSIIDSNKETQDVIKDQFNDCKEVEVIKEFSYKDITTDGYYLDNTGNMIELDSFGIIEYFEIKKNTNYTILKNDLSNAPSYCLYDENKTLISCQSYNRNEKLEFNSGNAKYISFSMNNSIGTYINLIFLEEKCSNRLDQAEETRKGIWETLKSIPGLILDGIKSLFVPSQEELQSLIDEFKSTMENKLGAIYQVSDMLIDVFRSIFSPTERNSCITFPEIKDPMFDKLLIEQTDYCFDSLRTDFSFLFTISDMIISLVCTLSFGNMLYKKYEGFIGGDTSDY